MPEPLSWNDVLAALQEEDIPRAARFIAAAACSSDLCPLPEEAARSLREAFFGLLGRRGYFTGSPEKIQKTVGEIHAVGPGFDLFDLARNLAQYDTISTECLGLRTRRLFPELRVLSPPCPCGRHPHSGP